MPSSFSNAALIIIGHGSTVNPDSSTPTHECADEIRRRVLFAEVVCAFWKEEPSMREVFYTVESELIFVVPNFISEGYFTREVLPRELRLDGTVTRRDGKTICFCDPVGIHPHMTRLLLHRADAVAPGVPRNETSLVIVGHGTSLNEQSRKAIEAQVAFIRAENHGFAEVLDAYMEEEPFIAKWDEIASAPNVVIVPFFIADGLHSYQDIPVLLGMESEPAAAASQTEIFRHNPHELRGKKLFYSSAVGTDPLMVDVILDQVADFVSRNPQIETATTSQNSRHESQLKHDSFVIGQVQVSRQNNGTWLMHHKTDRADDASLQIFHTPADARDIATYDSAGAFRALKTAPSLKRGWLLRLPDDDAVKLALDFLYPGALGFWRHWQNGSLQPVHLRETLGRQTGMYRFTNKITDEDAQQMVACECDAVTKCLRRITWGLSESQPLTQLTSAKTPPQSGSGSTGEIPLLCVEACTHVVSAAREIARRNHEAQAKTSA